MKKLFTFLFIPAFAYSQSISQKDLNRYQAEAAGVTIVRDNWGVAHVFGKTDAMAVFGCLYAQCEENFQKVEENNLEMMGRLGEIGKAGLYEDLQMKLIYDTAAAVNDYKNSPGWFKKLLDAAADGVNFFLYKHPEVHPHVLTHFEAWYALLRTNGSISATQTGGLTIQDMKNLYKPSNASTAELNKNEFADQLPETGSNGFAVAPSKTASHNAMIYINPHVTFYYRTEMQMSSDEGLNSYGAITWGTFFIFQGFNEYCGWMHTTSEADVADLYREKIEKRDGAWKSLYEGYWLPVRTKQVIVRYLQNNELQQEKFTAYSTGHGPVMGMRNGDWLSLKENNRSLKALMQSWLRTKAKGFEDFKKIMDMRSNSSDNTVFADRDGNIAYWHGNFIPKRDTSLNWNEPVDGTTSATDWKGLHTLDEMVHMYNPKNGWIQNCNSTPFTVSGSYSPHKDQYPAYMAPDKENYRAINAQRLLDSMNGLTMETLIHKIGYSHYLAAFEDLLPPLFAAYDALASNDSTKENLQQPISILKSWDRNSSDTSIATTIAIEWASRTVRAGAPLDKIAGLKATIEDLEKRFGKWMIPWGDVNRYQRVDDVRKFSDQEPSLPVGLAYSAWGSLPSFQARRFNTDKRYGYSGNSFIACVEFIRNGSAGGKVKAKSIVTGGQSFDPSSPHFTDQAKMYIDGNFKDVYFYKPDVMKHAVRKYHPGE